MLNFFVQLVNTVGVPMILVGTYKSLSVFDGDFPQLRRGTGQGDLVWDRMKMDKEWKLFVNALWHFQYTQKTCSLIDNLELGVSDFLCKLYYWNFALSAQIYCYQEFSGSYNWWTK